MEFKVWICVKCQRIFGSKDHQYNVKVEGGLIKEGESVALCTVCNKKHWNWLTTTE